MSNKPKLLVSLRRTFQSAGYADSTVRDYCRWVHRFIHFHNLRHPKDLGTIEVGEFINHIAVDLQLSSQSQTKALCAIVFLYSKILYQPIGDIENLVWSRHKKTLCGKQI
ncbi:MAG: phage integrase N-terminal SAM-like domain-containing protein [Pseudomonadales bacterium]|nr:phage integrase N-terminal SAM-like domain-containing protein [Pseudomonadales bacterium]